MDIVICIDGDDDTSIEIAVKFSYMYTSVVRSTGFSLLVRDMSCMAVWYSASRLKPSCADESELDSVQMRRTCTF